MNERVGEAQRRLELAHQHAACAARCRGVAAAVGTRSDLRQLDVPVAILVPHEFVQCSGREVEA